MNTLPDQHIIDALREPAPQPAASAKAKELYATLQECIRDYRAAVASSTSFEGASTTLAADTAAAQVVAYHAAYRQELQAGAVPPGTDQTLLAQPRGLTVNYSRQPLSV